MKKFNMESFFPAEETVKKGLSEARKKQQKEYLKTLEKANAILASEYNPNKLDELEELFQIILAYEEKEYQNDKQSETLLRREPYTFEDIKRAWNNPKPMTEEEIKNTFIEDDRPIDLSRLKL